MNLWSLFMSKVKPTAEQNERILRLQRNDERVEDLHNRAKRILNENHLGPAIKRALEGN